MNRNDIEFSVEKIRSQYVEKENTSLDELKALDNKVKRPAEIYAFTFGIIGAIIMGCGMSLVMTDIGKVLGLTNSMIPGIAIGVIGLFMVIVNYPIFKNILSSRRKKYAAQIIAVSDRIIGK